MQSILALGIIVDAVTSNGLQSYSSHGSSNYVKIKYRVKVQYGMHHTNLWTMLGLEVFFF